MSTCLGNVYVYVSNVYVYVYVSNVYVYVYVFNVYVYACRASTIRCDETLSKVSSLEMSSVYRCIQMGR